MKPLIKYTGSKFPFLAEIKTFLPENYDDVYIPFLGGGSYLTLFEQKNIYASDLLADLIKIFQYLKTCPMCVKEEYRARHKMLKFNGTRVYQEVKERYNKFPNAHDFLFLTRTCYNGLIRFNQKGEFNVGFHHGRLGIDPLKFDDVVDSWYELVYKKNNCRFYSEDYRDTLKNCQEGDLVLADPPYLKTKGQYVSNNFDFAEFQNQFNFLTRRGVKWIITMDDDFGLVKKELKRLDGNFYETSKKSSSFSRLKMVSSDKGNTVITNYD